MDKVKRRAPTAMTNFDTLLRDQFIEYVFDPALRRELKRLVRQSPQLTMLEARAEAIRWEREGRPIEGGRSRSFSVPSLCAAQYSRPPRSHDASPSDHSGVAFAELKGMLLKQQEQINHLTQSIASLTASQRPIRSGLSRAVICRRCQQAGHYARECDNERVEAPPPRTLVAHATSTSQSSGN